MTFFLKVPPRGKKEFCWGGLVGGCSRRVRKARGKYRAAYGKISK